MFVFIQGQISQKIQHFLFLFVRKEHLSQKMELKYNIDYEKNEDGVLFKVAKTKEESDAVKEFFIKYFCPGNYIINDIFHKMSIRICNRHMN